MQITRRPVAAADPFGAARPDHVQLTGVPPGPRVTRTASRRRAPFVGTGLPRHAVAVVSGGLEDATLAYWLAAQGVALTLLSVDDGQPHRIELHFARAAALALEADHHVADLTAVNPLLVGQATTNAADPRPHQHACRATAVPNREAITLAIAVAVAIATGADAVASGAHGGDDSPRAGCRPEFVDAFRRMTVAANDGVLPGGFAVLVPFADMTRADIIALGAELGVPFEKTWSCQRHGPRHCGTCPACTERRALFALAEVADPTEYAHPS